MIEAVRTSEGEISVQETAQFPAAGTDVPDVVAPGQVLSDRDAQQLKARHLLNCVALDGNGSVGGLMHLVTSKRLTLERFRHKLLSLSQSRMAARSLSTDR